MHAYLRHIGDYSTDTAHLTLVEHGAYTRLMDLYYTREEPLPAATVLRLVGARTVTEVKAVKRVLSEFFDLDPQTQHFRNRRCDTEIERFEARSAQASKAARSRWGSVSESDADALPMHSERNAGGMPTKTMNHEPMAAQGAASRAQPRAPAPEPPAPSPTLAGQACKAMRQVGVQDVNPMHPLLLRLLEAGASAVEELRLAATEAVAKGKPSFAYALATVAGRRKDAVSEPPPNAPGSRQLRERAVLAALAPGLLPSDPGPVFAAGRAVAAVVEALPSLGERNA